MSHDPLFDIRNRVVDYMGEFADDYDVDASVDRLSELLTNAERAIEDEPDNDPDYYSQDWTGIEDAIWHDYEQWIVEKESET